MRRRSFQLREIKRVAEKLEMGIPVDPQNPRSISNAVMKLAKDPRLVARYKRNLRVAKDELDWNKEETILRNLISNILAQNRPQDQAMARKGVSIRDLAMEGFMEDAEH